MLDYNNVNFFNRCYPDFGGNNFMTISVLDFLNQLRTNIPLLITVILTLGVILVNGWTDAPNAIATCVSTRSISPRAAILMAAIFNFLL